MNALTKLNGVLDEDDKSDVLFLSGLEDSILKIIESKDELTQSDIQGMVGAVVKEAFEAGKQA